jgi:hypothetical protein
MNSLNSIQLDILKLFEVVKSEKDMIELKQVLIQFLSKKTVEEADRAFDEKNYSQETFTDWQYGHFRITTSK